MIRKFLLILFLLISTNALIAQNYWIRSSFTPGINLNKVTFTDSTNFYAAADSGKIFHSSDAGISWSTYNTGINSNIYDINFLDINTGFAIAWEFGLNNPNFVGSIIMKTTNAGALWNTFYRVDTNIFFSKIYFKDNHNGLLTSQTLGILRTSNAGLNWVSDHIDSATFYDFPIRNFETHGSLTLACGGYIDIQGVIWRTTNNGVSWTAKGVSPEPLYDFHFYDDNHVIAVGGDFEYGASMASSTDAGVTWNYITLKQFGTALALEFRTASEGWMALSFGQKFLYTTNTGQTWNSFSTPNGESINDMKFSNKRNGIAVGEHGAILKFNTDYVGITNNNLSFPSGIELKQKYPNPFNPSTIISFTLQKPEYVSLKIYDMLGKEVKTLIDGMKIPGEHKIKFDANDVAAGIYYYTLKTGNNFTETKKMVLVK